MLKIDEAARLLARGRDTIRALAVNVPDEEARWRPAPDKWSILEVINHLYDEERSDFRLRLHILLHRPKEPWPAIDPQGWVAERKYNERRLFESLETFTVERNKSIQWLGDLTEADWNVEREHPTAGVLRAGDFLTAWVAHDYRHIEQLARLHKAWVDEQGVPYSSKYAG